MRDPKIRKKSKNNSPASSGTRIQTVFKKAGMKMKAVGRFCEKFRKLIWHQKRSKAKFGISACRNFVADKSGLDFSLLACRNTRDWNALQNRICSWQGSCWMRMKSPPNQVYDECLEKNGDLLSVVVCSNLACLFVALTNRFLHHSLKLFP